MVIESLSTLGVGKESVARSRLGRALERALGSGDLDSHGGSGEQASSRRMEGLGVHGSQSTRVSEARLLVGMFQLLLKGYSSTRDESRLGREVTVNSIAWLLMREVLHCLECRHTSDLGAGGEADRYRGAGGVGGGVLCLGHAIALVDRLTTPKLSVLSRARTEPSLVLVERGE